LPWSIALGLLPSYLHRASSGSCSGGICAAIAKGLWWAAYCCSIWSDKLRKFFSNSPEMFVSVPLISTDTDSPFLAS
jgi:hypothetical protein